MADIKGLEKAFFDASEEARRTYDILNGTAGRGGLEQKYLLALDSKEKNDAKPGSIRNFNIKDFNAIKKQYDAASLAYRRAQDAKNAARLELNRAQGTSEKQKDAQGALDAYEKSLTDLKKAEALIPSRGMAQYEAAVQAAYDAQTAAKNTGAKVKPLPPAPKGIIRPENKTVETPAPLEDGGVIDVAEDRLKGYAIESSGNVILNGERIYFVDTKNADGSTTINQYKSIISAREAFLKNYSQPGQLDALKRELVNRTWITKKQLEQDDWLFGLDNLIAKYTFDAATKIQIEGAKQVPFSSWFNSAKGGAGTGLPESKAGTFKDTDIILTTAGDAYTEINDYLIDAIGRPATQEEKEAYFKDINEREKKSAVEVVTTRDATGKITKSTRKGAAFSAAERQNSQNAIVIKALEGTDAGALLKSAKGSQVAIQIAALQKAGAEYGQPLTAGEALAFVIAGGTEKNAIQKQTERLRLNALTMYGNLKDHITNGGNVKDIADQYALIKSKKLGIPITDGFNDKDVQMALTRDGGLMSTAEFSRQMQANPLWRQTEEARNTASDFANTILKSFGFMG
jgi:hypothetical protein